MKKELELVIIKNKVMDITNLGWNPTQCNEAVVAFIGQRKLKHSSLYFDKELNLYEIDDLVNKYNLPLLCRFFTRRSKLLKQYLKENKR